MYDGNERLGNLSASSNVLRELNRTDLHVDSEITYVDLRHGLKASTTDVIMLPLYDVYNNGYHAGGMLRVHFDRYFNYSAATGSTHLGASLAERQPKYVRRMNLHDLTFRVGTIYQIYDGRILTNASIIQHLLSSNNTEYDVINRQGFQMGLHVQALLGYTPIYMHTSRWSDNDTHGGTLGNVMAGVTDICFGFGGVVAMRTDYMAVIASMRLFRGVFVFRTFGSQKPSLSVENVVFFKPFSTTVWWTLAACIVALSIGVHVAMRAQRQPSAPFVPAACLSAMTALGAFCQQGASIVPGTLNGRTLLMCMNVSSLLVYTYYTTEVLNALIASPMRTNIRTLEQLALSDMTVGLENVSHVTTYLKVSTPRVFLIFPVCSIQKKYDRHKKKKHLLGD